MKVLVVGSNGFLGKHVKNLLHKENKYNVLEITGKEQVDITQYHSLSKYLLENKPNIIINCAAFVGGISYGYQYPAKLLYENSTMAINLYRASAEHNIEKLINPISNCAYPENLTTYKEENFFDGPPDKSVYNYGISKRLFVQLGASFYDEKKLSSVNVVFSNMYGPHDHFDIERSHALGAIIKKVFDAEKENTKKVTIWGTGKPIREWLYVQDGAEALVRSINLEPGHHFFNVGSGQGYSVIEIANKIAKEFKWDGEFKLDTSKPDGVLEKKVNPKLGETILNWSPKTTIDEGIKLTVEWFIENEKNITQ